MIVLFPVYVATCVDSNCMKDAVFFTVHVHSFSSLRWTFTDTCHVITRCSLDVSSQITGASVAPLLLAYIGLGSQCSTLSILCIYIPWTWSSYNSGHMLHTLRTSGPDTQSVSRPVSQSVHQPVNQLKADRCTSSEQDRRVLEVFAVESRLGQRFTISCFLEDELYEQQPYNIDRFHCKHGSILADV